MNPFKKFFRRIAVFFVTLWAKYVYWQGVVAAEERHRKKGCAIYLASDSFRPDHLVTYDKAQFKTEKRVYGMSARLLTMNTLRRECWYYTAGHPGQEPMTPRDKEVRRRAFIKERLALAGLI